MTPQEWDEERDRRHDFHRSTGLTWFDALVRATVEMERKHGKRPEKEAAA